MFFRNVVGGSVLYSLISLPLDLSPSWEVDPQIDTGTPTDHAYLLQ